MDLFTDALVSNYTLSIPREDDWFGPLIGDWDICCYSKKKNSQWQMRGRWFFRRILDGSGVEDLLLCDAAKPKRSAALRLYDGENRCYTAVCTHGAAMFRLRFVKDGSRLIGTNMDKPNELHVFSDIQKESFTWSRVMISENKAWHEEYTIYASRMQK